VLVDARDVDDPAAASGPDHVPGRALGAQERSVEVGGEDVTPRLVGEADNAVAVHGQADVEALRRE
jgi:hypothetical protein